MIPHGRWCSAICVAGPVQARDGMLGIAAVVDIRRQCSSKLKFISSSFSLMAPSPALCWFSSSSLLIPFTGLALVCLNVFFSFFSRACVFPLSLLFWISWAGLASLHPVALFGFTCHFVHIFYPLSFFNFVNFGFLRGHSLGFPVALWSLLRAYILGSLRRVYLASLCSFKVFWNPFTF